MNNKLFSTLLEDQEYVTYKDVCKSFSKHFPNKSIDDLELIEIRNDECVTFKLERDLVCFRVENWCEECTNDVCFWRIIYRKIINVKNKCVEKDCEDIKLLNGSSDLISYELYPFEQTHEFELSELGYDVKILGEPTFFEEDDEIKWNDYIVKVGEENNGGLTYSIYLNNSFVSGICDQTYSLQLGDGHSAYYVTKDKLYIENCGDVSSVVVISSL